MPNCRVFNSIIKRTILYVIVMGGIALCVLFVGIISAIVTGDRTISWVIQPTLNISLIVSFFYMAYAMLKMIGWLILEELFTRPEPDENDGMDSDTDPTTQGLGSLFG